VDPVAWDAVEQAYPALRHLDHDLARPNRLFIEACEQLGAHCLDLLPAFRAHRGGRLHHRYDGHLNAAGHDLAAESIYRKLADAGLVPTARGTGRHGAGDRAAAPGPESADAPAGNVLPRGPSR
jgi:hypothetical protein